MKIRKSTKIIALIFAFLLTAVFAVSCNKKGSDPTKNTPAQGTPGSFKDTEIKITALKGPTGIGITKLLEESAAGTTKGNYKITLAASPDELTGKIINGELDVVALPTNVAATLYNKSNGKIKIAALNTLGVLYILEKGDTIQSLSDLQGKKIYATGEGSVPEYVLNMILKSNEIDAEVEYLSEHSELAAAALAGRADIILLPEPFVTTVLSKNGDFRIAVDITKEFEKAAQGKSYENAVLTMGCIVVNAEFAERNKAAFNNFLDEYKASALYATSNVKETAQLVAKYEIMASAELAEKAIPNCNIVYIDGQEMQNMATDFFNALIAYDQDASSIGKKLPSDEIYYQR